MPNLSAHRTRDPRSTGVGFVATVSSVIGEIFPRAGNAETRERAGSTGSRTRSILEQATITAILVLMGSVAVTARASEPTEHELKRLFADTVHPFLETHCFACHGKEKPKGKLNLSRYSTMAAVAKDHRLWETVLERLEAREMPPEKAQRQPTPERRRAVIDWIRALRNHEARRHAGDPGPVLARRLSNAEYDYTIRDLTGVDIRPTREFPIDPANEAGFDNSGESLTLSPALLKKYLAAARRVAEHIVLKPKGFVFAPHRTVTDTDRDKYCVKRIVDFYRRHRINYADYFLAAWRFRHRDALGKPAATLADFAAEAGISVKYLATIWTNLAEMPHEIGPLARLQVQWRALPGPKAEPQAVARRGCEQMRDAVIRLRQRIKAPIDPLGVQGISKGSQPFVQWKNRQLAANRLRYPGGMTLRVARSFEFKLTNPQKDNILHFVVADGGDGGDRDYVLWRAPHFRRISGPSPQPQEKKAKKAPSYKKKTYEQTPKEGGRDELAGKGDRPPKAAAVRERWTLRELLQTHAPDQLPKLRFGKHPLGHAIDADSFAVKAPAAVTVTIPRSALFPHPEDGWLFATEGAIDPRHFGGGAVQILCYPQRKGDGVSEAFPYEPLVLPANDPAFARYEAAFDRFCGIFPDTFHVSKRGHYANPSLGQQVRLLTAGFHLMHGYFRDDRPLYELILDEEEQRELDALWQTLHFVTFSPTRQYKDFIFFERAEPPRFMEGAEFDFARSEDRNVTSRAKIQRLAKLYLAKVRANGGEGQSVEAIQAYFANISADIRWVEQARQAAEPSHLEALQAFAERAYRRPLSRTERDELLAFHRSLRDENLSHEEAIRDVVVSVLISPYFSYRIDLPDAGEGAFPLSDYALASRLSYFLWSSMPDAELLARAGAGDLHRPDVLVTQTRRMLHDPRIDGLATEFGGHWLGFRRFEQHNAVDRERFQSFTDPLRRAMFTEPIRFFVDLVHRDGSVLDFLYAKHTFVNPLLAEHYGLPVTESGPNEWVRVDDARSFGRGGLLPMAVFLTRNAPGLRTSPVKRGNWVIRRLLGENVPLPPPQVPELPSDEAKMGDLTLRQLLAKHRETKSCASCHERFDSIGLVFEGYGPIGERRSKDLGGRPVDTHATFPGGSEGTGLVGLRRYLRDHRQEEFINNLCRKLLAYALGRSLLLSDEGTLNDMRAKLAANGYRFGSLIETLVTSPQFLTKRGRDHPMR